MIHTQQRQQTQQPSPAVRTAVFDVLRENIASNPPENTVKALTAVKELEAAFNGDLARARAPVVNEMFLAISQALEQLPSNKYSVSCAYHSLNPRAAGLRIGELFYGSSSANHSGLSIRSFERADVERPDRFISIEAKFPEAVVLFGLPARHVSATLYLKETSLHQSCLSLTAVTTTHYVSDTYTAKSLPPTSHVASIHPLTWTPDDRLKIEFSRDF